MQKDLFIKNSRFETSKRSWVLSISAACLALIVACHCIPLFFATNDDPYVIQVLSGSGGTASHPLPYVPFINYALCLPISKLYEALPSIPWWVVFHFSAIGLSIALIGRILLIRLRLMGKKFPNIIEFMLLVVVDFGVGAYFIGRLQFTSTSALLLVAAIIATCCWKTAEEASFAGGIIVRFILPTILASVGFALRSQAGLLGIFFWGLSVAALIVSCRGNIMERCKQITYAIVPLLVTCLVAFIITEANAVIYSNLGLESGNELGSAISNYTDYPRVSFNQDPVRYESVGWDEPLASLASKWFMMDERINTDALNSINEQNTAPFDELINSPASVITARLHDVTQPVFLAYIVIVFCAGTAALGFSTKQERPFIWIIGLSIFLLVSYLLLRGRLLERAAYAIVLPAGAALLSIVLRNGPACHLQKNSISIFNMIIWLILGVIVFTPLFVLTTMLGKVTVLLGVLFNIAFVIFLIFRNSKTKIQNNLIQRISTGLICFLMLITFLPGIVAVKKFGIGSLEAQKQDRLIANTDQFFDYAEAHPSSLYIYSNCPITMQNVWQGKWPSNQTGWGGWRYPYDWFDEAMRNAGFDGRPKSSDFFNGHTYFVSASEDTCDLLLRYMRNTYGPDVEMIQVDCISDTMGVYQFRRSD